MIAKSWTSLLIRGILAVIAGLITLFVPGLTLITLILVFGFYAFLDGAMAVGIGFSKGAKGDRWFFIIEGLLGILFGILAWTWPGATALVFIYWIAAWAIVTGVMELGAAIQLRKVISNELMLILGGIVSILFGVVVMMNPGAGGLAVVWMFGVYALIFGIMLISLSFKVKKLPV